MANPCYNPCESEDNTTEEEVPCTDGEKCSLVLDLNCVIYTGDDLPEIGIKKGDRGNKILELLKINHTSNSIKTEDTATVDLEGVGIESDKLKANVKISDDEDNLIEVDSEGLLVKFTPENILKLFLMIKNNTDLKDAWCELIHECDSCGLITDFQVNIT